MAPRLSTVLLASLLSAAAGVVAQVPTTVTMLWPDAKSTEVVRASVVTVNAAKSETVLKLGCGDVSSSECVGMNGAIYRTSPAGVAVDFTTVATSANVTTKGGSTSTNFVMTTTITVSIACPNPTAAAVTCDGTVLGNVAVANITEPFSSVYKTTYSGTAQSIPVTITAGELKAAQTTSSSTGGAAAAQVTQGAMLAGAMVVLGGAMMV